MKGRKENGIDKRNLSDLRTTELMHTNFNFQIAASQIQNTFRKK